MNSFKAASDYISTWIDFIDSKWNPINSIIFPAPRARVQLTDRDKLIYYGHSPSGEYNLDYLLVRRESAKRSPTIVYFHGNNEEITSMLEWALSTSVSTDMDIFIPEYPGYGVSATRGHTSVATIEDLAIRSIRYLHERCGVDYSDMIIIGRSIGTGPAIHVAATLPNISRLMLISPFTSLTDVACDQVGIVGSCISPRFNNYAKIGHIPKTCKVRFIHGMQDTLIPANHSRRLFDRLVKLRHGGSETGVEIVTTMRDTHNSILSDQSDFSYQLHKLISQ